MKRLLISLVTVGVVGVAAFGASRAFFSDTETSTGNTFTAGAIDLKIDNTSYATDPATGLLAASPGTTWQLSDLTVEKFFNFLDLKPGDLGEDTISVHVNSNDAWLCAAAQVTQDTDETCTNPELVDDPSCVNPGPGLGELDSEVNFAFWKDDGDNVFESDETLFLSGPVSGLNGVGQIALADTSVNSVFGQSVPIPGGEDVFIGKAWCFGEMTPAAKAQGEDTSPLIRGTGFDCDGSGVNNAAQTDKVVGDLQFYAVQSRNNDDFDCSTDYTPDWGV